MYIRKKTKIKQIFVYFKCFIMYKHVFLNQKQCKKYYFSEKSNNLNFVLKIFFSYIHIINVKNLFDLLLSVRVMTDDLH